MATRLNTPTEVGVPRATQTHRHRQRFNQWMYVIPAIVVVLAVTIYPLLYSLHVSLLRWNVLVPTITFMGLGNYARLLHDPQFLHALLITLVIMVVAVSMEFLLGLLLALALAQPLRGKRLITALLVLPVSTAPLVAGMLWRFMFDMQYGPVNQFLSWITHHPVSIDWLNNYHLALIPIIVADIWEWTPFMFLVLLAGLSATPQEILEAGTVDGASDWQLFWHITLPLLRPTILVALLIRSIDCLKIFSRVYAITNGGPGTYSQSVTFRIFQLGFQDFRLSYAAAATWIFLILVSIGVTLFIRVMRTA